MSFEVFQRKGATVGPAKGRRSPVPREFRIYPGNPGLLVLTRTAVGASGLIPGDRVLLLVDRDEGLFALLRTDEPSGWKVIPTSGGTAVLSLGRFLSRFGIGPGYYSYETFAYDNRAVPGFRVGLEPAAGGVYIPRPARTEASVVQQPERGGPVA